MKNFLFPSCLLTLLSLWGCKDIREYGAPVTPTQPFSLSFKASYNGERLEQYKKYLYGTDTLDFSRYILYLSDITLLNGTEEVHLADVDFFDFMPDTAFSSVSKIYKRTYQDVPEGSYTGIRLGYGVRPDLNAMSPADFPVGHPLYNDMHYWPGWESYIFSKVEGTCRFENHNPANCMLRYHMGSDQAYRIYTFNQPITVSASSTEASVDFDLKKLLTFNGNLLDLTVEANQATSHDASNITMALQIMDNYGNATTVDQ